MSRGEPRRLILALAPAVPMAFRLIPPGRFLMGARGEIGNEEPRHLVEITKPFWLGEIPVTQEQFAVWTQSNGVEHTNKFAGHPKHPAETLDWHQAVRFCRWLTEQCDLRRPSPEMPEGGWACLPTEAEWEYACRAGSDTEYHTGDGAEAMAEAGCFGVDSTHPAGLKLPNTFGLFDMHGNVWEWCYDLWDEYVYCTRVEGGCGPGERIRTVDFREGRGLEPGEDSPRHVLRGGSWFFAARFCRSAIRFRYRTDRRDWIIGFRVCLVPGPFQSERAEASQAQTATGAEGGGTTTQAAGADGAEVDLATESLPRTAGGRKIVRKKGRPCATG